MSETPRYSTSAEEYWSWPATIAPGEVYPDATKEVTQGTHVVHAEDGSVWVEVNDADLSDVLNSRLSQAQTDALTARRYASKRLIWIDGNATDAPAVVGDQPGDTVFVRDPASREVVAMWRWDGAAWQRQELGHHVIGSVAVGQLVAGTADIDDLAARKIAAKSGQFMSISVDQLTGKRADIDEAVVKDLWAAKIATGKVTADEIIVGSDFFDVFTMAEHPGDFQVAQGSYDKTRDRVTLDVGGSVMTVKFTAQPGVTYNLCAEVGLPSGASATITASAEAALGTGAPKAAQYVASGAKTPIAFTFSLDTIPNVQYPSKPTDVALFLIVAAVAPTGTKVTLSGVKVVQAATAVRIADGAVTAGKIAAGAVTAGTIAANAVTADSIRAGAIDGMIITGATVQTDKASNQGVKFNNDGLVAFNSAGKKVIQLNGRTATITGGVIQSSDDPTKGVRLDASSLTAWGNDNVSNLRIVGAYGGWERVQVQFTTPRSARWQPAIFTENTTGGDRQWPQGALIVSGLEMFTNSSGRAELVLGPELAWKLGTAYGNLSRPAYIEAQRDNMTISYNDLDMFGRNVTIRPGSGVSNATTTIRNGTITLHSDAKVIKTYNIPNSSGSYAVKMNSNWELSYASSTRAIKHDIKPDECDPEALLGLHPLTWWDKHEVETFTADPSPHRMPVRVPGLVAEDVDAAGLTPYVLYEDGAPHALHYDRLWILLIPLVRRLTERLNVLETYLKHGKELVVYEQRN